MLSVQQLRQPVTEAEALANLLAWLNSAGFVTSAWGADGPQLKILRAFAAVYATLTTYVAALVSFGFSELAEGEALTRFSRSRYANERNPAVAAQHRVVFHCTSGAGPYTFEAGQLIVGDVYGNVFKNLHRFTLLSGGEWTETVVCDTPGEAGNRGAPGTIIRMISSFAGVWCSNPAIGTTGVSLWVTGADEESDEALRIRNSAKWGTLGTENTAGKVQYVAINAAPGLSKAAVNGTNPRGAGTVDVYVSGATSTAGADDVSKALEAVRAMFFDPDPRINVLAAPAFTLPISGTVSYKSTLQAADVQAAVEASLNALIRAMPLGGYTYTIGPSGMLWLSDIIQAIETSSGVIWSDVSVGTALPYIDIPAWHVGVPPISWGLIYHPTELTSRPLEE